VKNRPTIVAGFTLQQSNGFSGNDNWLRDLAFALAISGALSVMFAFANAQPRHHANYSDISFELPATFTTSVN
jgi:hypothetical protein